MSWDISPIIHHFPQALIVKYPHTVRSREKEMGVQFLLLVIAVLLFVVFWELCKIKSQIKRILNVLSKMSGGHADAAVTPKTVE